MKTLATLIMVPVLLSCSSINAQNALEEAAVKNVIRQETNAVIKANYSQWYNTWMHDSACYILRSGKDNYQNLSGWYNINRAYASYMQNPSFNSVLYIEHPDQSDYRFRINGNVSIVTFKEGKDILKVCALEKDNGTWKITGIQIVDVPSYNEGKASDYLRPGGDPGEFDTTNIKIPK